MKTVVAVVLTYNGRDQAIDCLRSLGESDWPQLRRVLVDNASTDDAAATVAHEFPDVEIVRAPTNRGYAGGNNLGFAQALAGPCDHVFVLNDDTLVDPEAIRHLVNAMSGGVGAAAPLITYEAARDRVWYAGATYDPRRLHPGSMIGYRQRVGGIRARTTTDRFSGAAVLIPRPVLEAVGGFDESLHFLYEDVDLSLRIRAAGLSIVFEPQAIVHHKVAMTQGGEHSPTSFYYGIRNQLVVADRHAPAPAFRRTLRSLAAVGIHVKRLSHAGDRRSSARALWAGLRDYRRGRLGAWSE